MSNFYISVFDLQNRPVLERHPCPSLEAALDVARAYVKPKTEHVPVPYKADIRGTTIEALVFHLGGSVDQSKPPSRWWDTHVEATAQTIIIESQATAKTAWLEEVLEGNPRKPLQ